MIILSLDLSTKSTGYAIFTDDKLTDYGCITASSTDGSLLHPAKAISGNKAKTDNFLFILLFSFYYL